MKFLIKKYASNLGIDKSIFFTSSSSIIGAVGSVVSVLLVVKYLTNVEQGYYYTFGSIVAIQIFFELGLNGIITQYVAHEASNLVWEGNHYLEGNSRFKSRLSSLLHFSVKWYLFFAIFLLITLIIVGFLFFNKYEIKSGNVSWILPWILLAIGTVINLIVSPIVAFLQGLGKVKEMAKIQLIIVISRLLIIWIGLILGLRLYVLGLSSLITVILLFLLIFANYRKTLINIWNVEVVDKVNYRSEIFPFQWKIALSWISGYFIFQLFNPVLFATEGAIVAGQMGMTLAALNGILSLSIAWMTTKIPLFSGLIAQKDYIKLDNIFDKTLKQSAFMNFAALTFLFLLIFLFRYFRIELSGKLLGDRFLNYIPLLLMMLPVFLNQFVASWATYLRCHKQEPFLLNSIVGGVLCALSTILLGRYLGVIGITLGYSLITFLMLPWGYYIFKTKKKKWH